MILAVAAAAAAAAAEETLVERTDFGGVDLNSLVADSENY